MTLSVRDRLAALRDQHKKSAPSFTPGPRQKRAKVVEVLPDVTELVPAADLEDVTELIKLHLKHGAAERKAKKAKKPISEALKTACNDYGMTKARCLEAGAKVTYYPMKRESVNPQLLLNEGVSPEIIKRCTETTDTFAVRVSLIDAEDEEADDDDA